jgi:hypothetical protein
MYRSNKGYALFVLQQLNEIKDHGLLLPKAAVKPLLEGFFLSPYLPPFLKSTPSHGGYASKISYSIPRLL